MHALVPRLAQHTSFQAQISAASSSNGTGRFSRRFHLFHIAPSGQSIPDVIVKITTPFSSPTVREFPPLLYTSKFRSERNLINEVDNLNLTALFASSIESSALTGHAARDEFYPGALRRTLAVQLHHILVGRPVVGR